MADHDVLILGAGVAGLTAARKLAQAGRRVLILEAQERIGGRVLSFRSPALPVPIELGAEFIHGRPRATLSLAAELGLTVYEAPFDHLVRRGAHLIRGDYEAGLARAMAGLRRIKRDTSFTTFAARRVARNPGDAPIMQLARDFVEGFDAADPSRISAQALAREQEEMNARTGQSQFRLLEGYLGLVERLAAAPDPRLVTFALGMRVSCLRWKRGEAVAVASSTRGKASSFRAGRAIITCPLGILQLAPGAPGSLRFEPPLPAKHAAAVALGYGPVVKCVLHLKEPIWESARGATAAGHAVLADASFLHAPGAPFPTWWTARPLRLPLITGWAGGPRAAALSGVGTAELARVAVRSLAALLGQSPARVRGALVSAHVHDWRADPFSRGGYSYELVGSSTARRRLSQPVAGTLFFAGEAADTSGQASTVAGAISSAERAAAHADRSLA